MSNHIIIRIPRGSTAQEREDAIRAGLAQAAQDVADDVLKELLQKAPPKGNA